jgi:hypothetical protein
VSDTKKAEKPPVGKGSSRSQRHHKSGSDLFDTGSHWFTIPEFEKLPPQDDGARLQKDMNCEGVACHAAFYLAFQLEEVPR